MDEDMRRCVVKEHYRQGDVVRALREADGLELDDDTLCALATHCMVSAASFGHLVQSSPSRCFWGQKLRPGICLLQLSLAKQCLKSMLKMCKSLGSFLSRIDVR